MSRALSSAWLDRLKAWPQFILPQHLLSRLVYAATRVRQPLWKNTLIRGFIRHYRVDMTEARVANPEAYEHFNAFFTRALRDGARSHSADPDHFISPVDGYVSQIGELSDRTLLQAKGRAFSLNALLGNDEDLTRDFRGGAYATLYLSPRDYHRIHMPVDGVLRATIHIPGRLFAVNPATTRVVAALFARNERIVCIFDTAHGPLAVILIGAIFVGSMETVWAGRITPSSSRAPQRWNYSPESYRYRRGDEIGRFNMGSTVIVLMAKDRVRWEEQWQPDMPLKLGVSLGTLIAR